MLPAGIGGFDNAEQAVIKELGQSRVAPRLLSCCTDGMGSEGKDLGMPHVFPLPQASPGTLSPSLHRSEGSDGAREGFLGLGKRVWNLFCCPSSNVDAISGVSAAACMQAGLLQPSPVKGMHDPGISGIPGPELSLGGTYRKARHEQTLNQHSGVASRACALYVTALPPRPSFGRGEVTQHARDRKSVV